MVANSVTAFAACAILVVALTSEAASFELIENGSFEADAGGFPPFRTGWDDGPSEGNDVGFSVNTYPFFLNGQEEGTPAPGGFEPPPGARDPSFTGTVRPSDAGAFYGHAWGVWNGNGQRGLATQIVDTGAYTSRRYEFSAWVASHTIDTDYAIVSLEFFDQSQANGTSLGEVVFDGNDQSSPFIVGSLNLMGDADVTISATQDNWTLYRTTGTIPADAISAAIVIQGVGIRGGGNDAYVDLVSLQVVPEMSSAWLLALTASLLLLRNAWHSRKRTDSESSAVYTS
jgi:hypothetical protein